MRGQLRMIVCAAVAVVIVIALIVESPGSVEAVGLAVVFVAMIVIVVQELRRTR